MQEVMLMNQICQRESVTGLKLKIMRKKQKLKKHAKAAKIYKTTGILRNLFLVCFR